MNRLYTLLILTVVAAFLFAGCGYYHVVKKGETVYSISKKYGVSEKSLMNQNNINDPTNLQIGKKLKIPREEIQTSKPGKQSTRTHKTDKKDAGKQTKEAIDKVRKKQQGNAATPIPKPKIDFIWPVKGVVVGTYGKGSDGRINDGLDIAAPEGSKIVAAADGEVIMSSDEYPAYGNLVVIRHKHNYITLYAHNRVNLVRKDDKVTAGQKIAEVGSTGRASTPTTHFEIRIGSTPVDPIKCLPPQ